MRKREIVGFIILFFLLIGLGVFLGNVLYSLYDNQIKIVEKTDIIEVETEEKKDIILPEIEAIENNNLVKDDFIYKEEQLKDEIINIVLLGVDARSYDTKSRSDTILLLSYNKTTHTVKMISFLRDTWVYLPERGWSRINSATAYGGTGLLINTLNENFDLDVQNYVQIKFEDFKKVIDKLGGLDVELTKSEIRYINNKLHTDDNDWKNDIKAEPGIVHLNGTQTLWHCRNRSIGDGDFARTDRQRYVLELLIEKAMTMSLPEMTSFIYEMKDCVDMNIPIGVLLNIAQDAIISGDIKVESYRVPFDNMYRYANKNGASVIEIDIDETTDELHLLLGLKTPEEIEEIQVERERNKPVKKPVQESKVEEQKVEEPKVEEIIPSIEEPDIVNSEPVYPEDINNNMENIDDIDVSTENTDNIEVNISTENTNDTNDTDDTEVDVSEKVENSLIEEGNKEIQEDKNSEDVELNISESLESQIDVKGGSIDEHN